MRGAKMAKLLQAFTNILIMITSEMHILLNLIES